MIFSPATIELLRYRLQQPLPGLDAQMRMAPPVRKRDYAIPENVKRSAVLALMYPNHAGILHFALMKRTEDGHAHSGQVSFPGGKWEQDDPDYVYTALRETEEEFGVPASSISVIGSLTELYIPVSNYLVYPSVGFIPERPCFNPDPREVAAILEIPIMELLKQQSPNLHPVVVSGGFRLQAPGYVLQEHLVWGATAMMLAELKALYEEVIPA